MHRSSFYVILFIVLFTGCKKEKKQTIWHTKQVAQENAKHNRLLDIEKEQGWELLFDGKTLNGWHLFNAPNTKSVWKVVDGQLYCGATDDSLPQGDLVTDKDFENYELMLEWRISGRGNSGVFINVQEGTSYTAAWQTGPEYQILDPEHMDYGIETKKTGCLYGFSPQLNDATTKPQGKWNQSRIVQKDGKIEFYLNGTLTAVEDFGAKAWQEKVANSGFKDKPDFGAATKGKIALQDWYFEVWFRNIKIRQL